MTTRLLNLVLTALTVFLYTQSSLAQCTTTISNFPYTEGFESDLGGWTGNTSNNVPPANGNWGRLSGNTGSSAFAGTGPSFANEGSFYLYTEVSGQGANTLINLESPCFQLPTGSTPSFIFDYHMYSDVSNASAMGSLTLEVDSTSTLNGTWDTLWTISGNQGNQWNNQAIDLAAYAGMTVKLRFKGQVGSSDSTFAGDRAIDNLILNTTGLTSTPIYCAGGSNGSMSVLTGAIATPATYLWNTGLTSSTINNLSAGTYTVTVTDNNSNVFTLTDSLADGNVPVISGEGYAESFESGFGDWYNDSVNDDFDWTQLTGGTPTGTTGPSNANDGSFYVYTESSNPQGANDVAILVSPCFDLSEMVQPYFRFDYHLYVQTGGFPARLQTDIGTTYILADTTPTNPSQVDTIWSRVQAEGDIWVADSIDLTPYKNTELTLKFVGIISNGNNTQAGDRAFDNLQIKDVADITDACDGISGGAITVNPFFGTTPYSFVWSNGVTTSNTISGLAAGTYSVTITDNTTATESLVMTIDSVFIPVPSGLTASSTSFCANELETVTLNINYISGDATFSGNSSLLADFGSGGTVGSDIDFTINGTPATATGPGVLTISYRGDMEAPGEYVHTFSENGSFLGQTAQANGQCSQTFSTTSYNISTDSINFWAADDTISLFGESIGMTRYCNGGGGNFFSWLAFYNISYPYTTVIPYWFAGSCDTVVSNAVGEGFFVDVNPDTTTTYYVRFYNAVCGSWGVCDSITINVDTIPTLSISPSVASYCNTPVSLTASGANTYSWIPGTGLNTNTSATVLASPSSTITYDLIGTDLNGCFDTTQVTVNNVPLLIASVTIDSNASCFGSSDGGATVTATLGSGSYTYAWSTGATTQSITGMLAGSYQVTVSDSVGCQDVVSFSIIEPTQVSMIFTSSDPCNGSSNGSITAVPSGGNGSYTYLWNNAQTSVTASGLAAGTYTVTVTDVNGCTGTGSQSISNSVLTAATSSDSVSCFGGSDGTATGTPSGATGPYFYTWLNSSFSAIGQSTQTATGLTAGQYFVQVSSSNGCNVFNGITVLQPATAVSVNITSSTNVTCNGGSDGAATANTTGGIGTGYTFMWSTGDSTATITNLSAGTYIVSSTDGNGCEDTTQIVITEPAIVSGTTATTSALCNGAADGTATISPAGGSGSGYTYLWSNGQTTQTATGLAAGSYDVTISDGNACTGIASATVNEPAVLTSSTSVTNALCNASATGTATVTGVGGTTPYSYLWSDAQTTLIASSLSAGTYYVTITDTNGCTTSDSAVITEPTAVASSIASSINVDCFGQNTGSASATATGGTGTYTYLWNDNSTNDTISSIAAGTYSVTIADVNGCTDSSSVIITEPALLVAAALVDSNVSCNNGNDGGATALATGGTGSYSYLWSNGQSSISANGLNAGTHTVTISDANGCTDTETVTITEPAALIASTIADSNTSCNGSSDGGATASATGGTLPYSFLWSNGATTASITGITAGDYFVTITDNNLCLDIDTITIAEPTILVASVLVDSNISCNNGSDGGATTSATGGTMPYTYVWSNGETTASITGIIAGTYSVTITDANGCFDSTSTTITQPSSIVSSAAADSNVSCNTGNDGGATAFAIGGTPAYNYAWSNGATTASITGIIAGTYSVTITDANGCFDSTSISITEPTAVLASTTVDSNTSCNGLSDGGATAAANGGTGTYTYAWSNGQTSVNANGLSAGVHTVTISDANGCTDTETVTISEPAVLIASTLVDSNTSCNGSSDGGATASAIGGTMPYSFLWSNGATTASITGITAGDYIVTITDNNQCFDLDTITITEPTLLVASTLVDSNISCNNGSDGGASASGTGGTTPYNYLWSNGSTTISVTGIAAGTYSVTITDANGCTDSTDVIISEPAILVSSIATNSNVSCNNGSDASATASANGGTAPYTYAWSNATIAASASGLMAGTYSVTITDANGCFDSTSIVITEPTQMTASAVVDSNATCYNINNGGGTASATGGTGSYSYLWSNGQTSASANGLLPGTHIVTVTDANGCTDTASITVLSPAAVNSAITIDSNVSCNGGSDGGATISVSSGTGSFSFLWSNGVTNSSISGVHSNIYSVTVTDGIGCTDSNSVTITEPATLIASTITDSNVSCNTGNDGGATAAATGGTMPYLYAWSNGATTASITGIATGTYSVTVTDANGCFDSTSISITEPATLISSIITDSNVSCNTGSDGAATASAIGGTMPYLYAWSNAATAASITGLSAGTYSVTITDANGCFDSTSVTITEPAAVLASTIVDSNASCNGALDGVATASATGGTGAYAYLWSNGQISASANGLAAGTHTVTITDANGCFDTETVTITEPATFVASTIVDSNTSCNAASDGGATASAVGGTMPYNYAWSNSATTASISGIIAGTYYVTITDANGCFDTDSVIISEPTLLVTTATLDSNVSCNTGNDGGATSSATGGTMPYNYAWSDGSTTASITGVAAGTYSVTITDVNGCFDSTSITISEPATLVSSIATDSIVSCNTGSDGGATASAVGGTMPYLYSWSTAETTSSITGLAAGTYSVTITDANGCFDSTSVTITEPAAVVASTVVDSNASCNGVNDGVATASAIGGTGAYSYNWSNGQTTATATGLAAGAYSVTITDANGCFDTANVVITEPALLVASTAVDSNISCNNGSDGGATASAVGGTMPYNYVWSNAATTASITGISAGTYFVTITDANGCIDTDSVIITEPTLLVASAALDSNVSCNTGNDGGATSSAVGGTMPYDYAWSNGATSTSITGIAAGTYSVTITDANGCFDSISITITEPATLVSSIVTDSNVSCNTGSDGGATASAIGGTMLYTYAWSNAATTASITGLSAGTYSVTITDANGCFDSTSVTITEPTTVVASTIVDSNASCNAISDGGATASATGGTGAYTFNWSNGQSTATATGLGAGTHTVTITDANGCFDTANVVITEPALLVASTGVDSNISCNNGSDGGATSSAVGGTMPYAYAWSNGATTASITGVSAGTYFITITDVNGCFDTDSVIITEPIVLITSAALDSNVSCNAGNDGGATASATGGTMPYTYAWSNAATTASITGLIAGNYSVTITDANGCFDSTSITITEPASLVSSIIADSNVSCNTGNDGGATASAIGGTMPYTYAWSNTATTAAITGLTAGAYSVTITDANGCFDSTTVTITEPTAVVASTMADSNASCNGVNDGVATASAIGGTGAYTFNWSNGQTTATANGLGAGTHTVTITDVNGCFDTANVLITEPDLLIATATLDNDVNCNGGNDGQATVSAIGGTTPYTYLWSNGQTTATAAGLAAATYFVTVTDSNGCFDSDSVVISEPTILVASISLDSNASCFGTATGGATASAIGGFGTYSFTWNHGPTTASIDGLAAGTYTVVIQDQNGCIDSASITIIEPTALSSSSVQISGVNCFGGNDGSATTVASGGTAPYLYLWSSGETLDTANALIAGNQFVTVTDNNGCLYIDSLTITEPATLISTTTQVLNNVLCNGDTSALAFVTATGGTPGYSYTWDNGSNNDTASFSVGSWFVTVTDANGCFTSDSVVITEPGVLASNIDSTHNISCFGLTDGELFASAAFGTAPYSYSWSNGSTSSSITGLAIGSYQLTITDVNGCTDTTSGSITAPDSISNTFTVSNVSCNAGADAYLISNASGGTSPYVYAWAGSSVTTDSLGGLIAGVYTVTITDNNGCANTFSDVITEPTALIANTIAFANVTCNGDSSGIAIGSGNGGTTPYSFAWPSQFTTNGDTAFGLYAGTFAVTVTDANNCSTSENVTITEPNALVISIDSSLDVNCVGGNDGYASIAVAGGTGTYNYNWSNGSTNAAISNLTIGTYCVTVSDANGCSDSICVVISETNALPIVNLGADYNSCDTITTVDAGNFSSYAWSTTATTQTIDIATAGIYSVTVTDVNGCQNSDQISVGFHPYLSYDVTTDSSACSQTTGAAHVLNLTGGGGYTINWSTGQIGGLNLLNLASGNYSVNISDQNGCSINTPFTVQDIEPIAVFTTITPVTCVNGTDGAIAIDSTQGSSLPASYLWSNGDTTTNLNGLTAGTYDLTITGTFGCQTYYSYTVGSPTPITFNVSVQNSTCTDSNGVATVSGILPVGTYTYQWNDYLSQTTISAANLPAASYSVTVTNANGCTKVKSGIVNDLSAATLAVSVSDANCEGQTSGEATVLATGNGPFTYAWNDPNTQSADTAFNLANGSYLVTVTDANACITIDSASVGFTNSNPTVTLGADTSVCANFFILSPANSFSAYTWNTGSSNSSISASTSGNYAVTVTDANGCEAADTIDLTLNTPISFTANQTNSSCSANSGSVVLNVLSGGGSYIYDWSNGANTSSITNLGNGTYDVTISDANGCEANDSYNIIQTTAPTLSESLVDPICNAGTDGSISLITAGGTAPLTYAWSNGATSNNLSNLMAGAYNVTVTDDSGCVVLGNYILDQPTPITIGFSVNPSSCGNADGSAEALIGGNQGPAAFIWNDANATDSAQLVNVTSGTYQVTVTDSAGCSASNAANISDFGAAVVSTGSINNNCDNEESGEAYAIATGVGPFSYAWNDAASQVMDTASNLANGAYTVSVTDINGCLTIATTTVSSFYEAPMISLGDDVSTCEGNEIILTAGGGFSNYNWNTGETTVDISPTTSGSYSITVTDVNACSNLDTAIVSFVLPPLVDLGADTIVCLDDQLVNLTLDASASFVNYAWNTGDTTSTIEINTTGVYSVNVDNGDKCVGTDAIIVVFDSCLNVGQDEIAGLISDASLTLYPNPTRGNFVIETSGLPTGDYLVRINSISGQMVDKRNLNITAGIDSRDEFNLQNAAKGIYILSIEGNDIKLNQRVIVN
jgi:hypothetical protein